MQRQEDELPRGMSPFVDLKSGGMGIMEAVKVVFLSPLVVVVLVLVLLELVLLAVSVKAVLALNLVPERRLRVMRGVSRTLLSLLIRTLGFRIKVRGRENLEAAERRRKPFVVVGNHTTFFDSFAAGSVVGCFQSVARQDVAATPLMGTIARAWGSTFIDRSARGEGLVKVITEKARDPDVGVGKGPMLLFPEGTTSNGQCLLSFRSGAFVAGLPVLPVVLRFRCGHLNPCWVAPHNNFMLFCRIVTCWRKTLEVHVLPIHHPSTEERADPKLYASNVADEMACVLGVPALKGWNNIDALEFNKGLYNFVG